MFSASSKKVATLLREEGVGELVRRGVAFAYRRGIRPLLPRTSAVYYGGVPVAHFQRRFDGIVPRSWVPDAAFDCPGYESTLSEALRRYARTGDRVVVVGGGAGMTVVVAARAVGKEGVVICFEGARECVAVVRATVELNGVAPWVDVRHAVVARSISVYGTEPAEPVVAPEALPDCDVLELDCEGAERDILAQMKIRPRVILVETHGLYGASTEAVVSQLTGLGYEPTVLGVAEPRLESYCLEHDIFIVAAERLPQ